MTFDAWWDEVLAEAKRQGMAHHLGDKYSHFDGFNEGYTPKEEVEEAVDAARSSL